MGNFELWTINPDGSDLERITYSDGFDGFRCSRGTERSWYGLQTGMPRRRTRRIFLSGIGCLRKYV